MYRYRLAYEEGGHPLDEWANDPAHLECLSEEERAIWLNPDNWQSLYAIQQRQCSHCNQWEDVDAIGGLDECKGMGEGWTLSPGTYTLGELPEFVRDHFTEEAPSQ